MYLHVTATKSILFFSTGARRFVDACVGVAGGASTNVSAIAWLG